MAVNEPLPPQLCVFRVGPTGPAARVGDHPAKVSPAATTSEARKRIMKHPHCGSRLRVVLDPPRVPGVTPQKQNCLRAVYLRERGLSPQVAPVDSARRE